MRSPLRKFGPVFFRGDEKFRTFPAWARTLAALLLLLEPAGAGTLLAAASGAAAPSAEASLKNISYDKKLLRIELDRAVPYRVFSLAKPPRLVVELSDTAHGAPYEASVDDGILKRIRSAQFQTSPQKITRVVLDLPKPVTYEASQQGADIVLQFLEGRTAEGAARPADAAAETKAQKSAAPELVPAHKTAMPPATLRREAKESLTATAAEDASGSPSSPKAKAYSKDLLASMPRHPITIDFDDADIRDVLRVMAEMSGVNIIHGPELRGFVTIHLDQVPFNEAFETILTMQGLVAQQMGENILRILTPQALSEDRSRAVLTYKTFVLNYAKAADLLSHLGSVKISPNAKATVDERTNSLIVTDTPEGLAAAERLISELDKKPEQVMIEAKMVEITLSDTLDLGIQWEYSNINRGRERTVTTGIRETKTGSDSVDTGAVGFASGTGEFVNPSSLVTPNAVSSVGPGERGTGVALPGPQQAAITFGFINNTDLLTATLNALSTKGKTKILSSPKVVTVNNRPAKIQSGSKIPFSITTVAATGVATQSFQFVDVGILLSVTPTISADNRIRMLVKPEVSLPGSVTAAGPEINSRNAETEVLVRDGETIVIGGLIDETMIESASKVPLLGDIPVLGTFFRNTSDTKRRTELLIFVTPHIIRD